MNEKARSFNLEGTGLIGKSYFNKENKNGADYKTLNFTDRLKALDSDRRRTINLVNRWKSLRTMPEAEYNNFYVNQRSKERPLQGVVVSEADKFLTRPEKIFKIIKDLPKSIHQKLLESRMSRLEVEQRNNSKNKIQRTFSKTTGRWVLKPAIEAIPLPITFGYGPGDLVTLISAFKGQDILTGDELDSIDRAVYLGASIIPVVPSTLLIIPINLLRNGLEEMAFALKEKDSRRLLSGGNKVRLGIKILKGLKK